MAYKEPCAFHLQNFLSRLIVLMHGIVTLIGHLFFTIPICMGGESSNVAIIKSLTTIAITELVKCTGFMLMGPLLHGRSLYFPGMSW